MNFRNYKADKCFAVIGIVLLLNFLSSQQSRGRSLSWSSTRTIALKRKNDETAVDMSTSDDDADYQRIEQRIIRRFRSSSNNNSNRTRPTNMTLNDLIDWERSRFMATSERHLDLEHGTGFGGALQMLVSSADSFTTSL